MDTKPTAEHVAKLFSDDYQKLSAERDTLKALCVELVAKIRAEDAAKQALAEHDALASLAPVDVEFLNIANDCRAVASMKMLSVSTRSRLLLAAEIVEKSSAQVAALTAQCEGMSCAAREYLAAVAHLFDSKAGKDGKFLAELSPLDDQQCLEAFKNLNDTGARLKKCCGGLQK